MKRFYLLVIAFVAMSGSAAAFPKIALFGQTATKTNMNIQQQFGAGSYTLPVNPEALQAAYNAGHFIIPDVSIPAVSGSKKTVSLDVEVFSVIGPESKFLIRTDAGTFETDAPTVHTYRGTVIGSSGSRVVLSISPDGSVMGMIRLDGEEYSIGKSQDAPYSSVITANTAIPYFADRTQCLMNEDAAYDMKNTEKRLAARPKGFATPQNVQVATKTCVVAFDADYQCFQSYGSATAINDYLATLMGMITTAYEDEVDMAMTIGTVTVYSSPDPYTGGNLDAILNSFTNYWPTHSEKQSIDRTLAFLLSRKLGGSFSASGLAWLDVMCDKERGYAVANITGSTNLPSMDASVIAHELGHNVGSAHTHNCAAYPPNGIDHCVPNDGGNCSWTPVQEVGTIMSYCNQKTFTFGERVAARLKQSVDAAPCLQSLASSQVKLPSVEMGSLKAGESKDSVLKDVIKSNGSVPLKISSVQFLRVDGSVGDFKLKNPPAFPITLNSGQSQSFTVTFQPQASGPSSAIMYFYVNATGGKDSLILNGGVSQQVASIINPLIEYPNPISDRNDHDTTVAVIQNIGDAPLRVDSFVIKEDFDHEFSVVNPGTPFILNAQEFHTVTIRFRASVNGAKAPYLWVYTDDPVNPSNFVSISALVENLTDKGYLMPFSTKDFGTVTDQLLRQQFLNPLIKNESATPLHVSKVDITNDIDNEFTVVNGSGFTLNEGESRNVTVNFKAKKNGEKSAFLNVYIDQPFTEVPNVLLTATVTGLPTGGVSTPLPPGVGLSIAPNPTSEVLKLSLSGLTNYQGKKISASLYDNLGKEVISLYSGVVSTTELNYNWILPASLAAGNYILVLDLGAERIGRDVIVK